jgi:hypothetical protein
MIFIFFLLVFLNELKKITNKISLITISTLQFFFNYPSIFFKNHLISLISSSMRQLAKQRQQTLIGFVLSILTLQTHEKI